MKTIPPRMIIFTKDVVNITGKKERSARNLLARIRAANDKTKNDLVTIEEFCAYTRLSPLRSKRPFFKIQGSCGKTF